MRIEEINRRGQRRETEPLWTASGLQVPHQLRRHFSPARLDKSTAELSSVRSDGEEMIFRVENQGTDVIQASRSQRSLARVGCRLFRRAAATVGD